MPDTLPAIDWPRLFGRADTAARLASLGGREADGPTSLPGRAWSRVRSMVGLLFTARQKRFNLEVAAAVRDLCQAAEADRDESEARFAAVWKAFHAAQAELIAVKSELSAIKAKPAAATAVPVAGPELLDHLRSLVEPIHFRPGTFDHMVWAGVSRDNEYRLPDHLAATDVVIDVGSHIGSFSHACLMRGAGKVFAFEVSPENFAQATVNLARFGGRAQVTHAAVWRSDGPPTTVYFNASHVPENTGAGNVLHATGVPIPAIPLDQLLTDLPARCGRDRVRLLKLDCEGSEFPILLTSRRLDLVDEIVGEYHVATWEVAEGAKVAGYPQYTREVLVECLERAGFAVEVKEYTPILGAFFARRK